MALKGTSKKQTTPLTFGGKSSMTWILLFHIITASCHPVISKNDHKYLCFPESHTSKYAICFDMALSKYINVPLTSLSATDHNALDEDKSSDPKDKEDFTTGIIQPRGSTEAELEKVIQKLFKRLVQSEKAKSKRFVHVSKRPFDSIAYGSYFGGFGKKR